MFTLSLTAHLSQIRCLFDLNTPQNSSDFAVVGQAFKSNTPSIKVKSTFRSYAPELVNTKRAKSMIIHTYSILQYAIHQSLQSLSFYTQNLFKNAYSGSPIRINGQVHKMTVFLRTLTHNAYKHGILKSFAENLCALFPLGIKARIKALSPAIVPARDQISIATKMLPLGKNCDRKAGIATDSDRSVSIATAYFNSPECAICPVVAYYSSLRQSMEKQPLTPVLPLNSSKKELYREQVLGQSGHNRDKKMSQLNEEMSQLSLLGIVGASCNR